MLATQDLRGFISSGVVIDHAIFSLDFCLISKTLIKSSYVLMTTIKPQNSLTQTTCSELKYELKGSIQDLVHDGSLLMLRVGSSSKGAFTYCII